MYDGSGADGGGAARGTLSMMETSMVLMVTGGSLMPRTQEPSQGAGQTRPVNSGKLLVSSSRNSASRQRPWCTRLFHSGILFPSGQPAPAPPGERLHRSYFKRSCLSAAD